MKKKLDTIASKEKYNIEFRVIVDDLLVYESIAHRRAT
jgi:hypothetical protein